MPLRIEEVSTKSEIKAFVNFEFEIYKNSEFWVPPIKDDEKKALSATNPALEFCDAKFYLAYDDDKCVGRIGAVINHEYNKKVNQKLGRINRIEFIDDPAVFNLLIDTASGWFRKEGMNLTHGPLGYTNLDTQGLLIEGFDQLPCIGSVYHLPYYKEHFKRCGFEKENDWLEFRLTISPKALDKGTRGAEIIKKRFGFEVVNIETKKEMKFYAPIIFEILNEAFAELPYVSKLSPNMINLYLDKYIDVLDPRFITLVKKEEEIIGFFVGLPNLSKAMQKANGHLYPLGFTHVLKALKNPEVIDMMLTGVKPEYQSSGVAVILIGELQNKMMKLGIDQMETTGVFETNQNVIGNWKNYEHTQHKRRRCYVKPL